MVNIKIVCIFRNTDSADMTNRVFKKCEKIFLDIYEHKRTMKNSAICLFLLNTLITLYVLNYYVL